MLFHTKRLIYGPRDTNSFARLVEQGKMVILGSGNNSLLMIYVRDVARGVLQAGDTEQAIGRAYLLVSDEPITQSGYFNVIARELVGPTAQAAYSLLPGSRPGGHFGDGGSSHAQ